MNADELKGGFLAILNEVLQGAKVDLQADVAAHLEDLSSRAARYSLAAASGDPDAATELELVKGVALSIAAQINRRESERIQDAMMKAIHLAVKFVIGVALAA